VSSQIQESTDGGQQLLLGKMLLERGLITPDQLREALADRARSMSDGSAKPLGIILVAKGFLSDTQLVQLLAEQANRPSMSNSAAFAAPPPPRAAPSATRLGKYELINELGRGGMGVVYEALDTQLNRKVALKLMLTNPSADAKEVSLDEERFVQEAQLSAKLKHPNIVTVYEAGILEGRRFLAMELIEGQAFSDWRKDSGAALKQQVEILRDVALAVHHAHEQGILHRDLKPRNVLVGAGNHPYVTDFGLAKSLGTAKTAASLTGSGAVVGTPAYMSPEQAQGNERVDWRTDIWSMGVMLFEVLTGRTPFTGESPIEILMKVVKDPVPPPSTVVEGGAALALDRTIETISLKALAKRDRDRYVTARAFAEDLGRWLNGEQVKVNAPRSRKRSHAWAYILGAAAGVLLVLAAVWFMISKPSVQADLVQARRFMELENYIEAAVAFSSVLKVDPKNEEALQGAKLARDSDLEKKKRELVRLRQAFEASKREEADAQRKAEEIAKRADEALTVEEREKAAREKAEAEERARLAGEAARKFDEQLKIKMAIKSTPAGTAPVEDAWKNALNLLMLVEFPRSVVWGTWSIQESNLVSDRESYARIEIPYSPPEEYDARVVFSRLSGSGEIVVILPTRDGKAFALELGGFRNTLNSFQAFRGAHTADTSAGVRMIRALDDGRPYTVEIQVRKDGVRAKVEGQSVPSEGKVDLNDLSLDPSWSLRAGGGFGLGSHGSGAVFQRFDVLAVTGRGVRGQVASLPTFKAPPVSVAALKPGMAGTYFYGANFEVLAVAQVDPAPSFRWNESPAWKGGPADAFSVRWTGYLHIPKGGRYAFTLSSDDGARLFIDDAQVISNWKVNAEAARSPFIVFDEGYHKIEVEYFEETYQASVELLWTDSADVAPSPVPTRLFFHDSASFKPQPPARFPELLAALPAHGNSVTAGAFSPDGKHFATVSEDKKAKLWNVASRREVFSMPGHTQGILCVAFSPDGSIMATGGWDNRIRLWEAATGLEVKVLEGHDRYIAALAFSPDGKLLASGSFDQTIKLWDPADRKLVKSLQGHAGSVEGLAFSPDGKTLASGSLDHTVRLWAIPEGKEARVIASHAHYVQGVAFSPDGKTLASASWDGLVKIWDTATGQEKASLAGHTREVLSVAFSPDGKLLASGGSDGVVRLWDPESGREVRALPGHTARVLGVSFAHEGRLLVSVSFDATARLWDVKSW
jgi:WD40 repeat protein/serine/threonine protein kinase